VCRSDLQTRHVILTRSTPALFSSADSSGILRWTILSSSWLSPQEYNTRLDAENDPAADCAITILLLLGNFNEESCVHPFRFRQEQILSIAGRLRCSMLIMVENRSKVSRVEALCFLLYRTSYPSRLEVMETTFGKSFSAFSRIVNSTTDLVLNSLGHLLSISSS
jgi:hypothetical protein